MENFTTDAKISLERAIDTDNTLELPSDEDLVHTFDIINTEKWISENNFVKVCLQFPDSLLGVSAVIYEELKKRVEVDLYILGDTSYASCCVDSVAAMHVEADAIVHYGRSCLTKTNIPVHIVLPKKKLNIEAVIEVLGDNFSNDRNIRLCMFYDIQYEHCKNKLLANWYKLYPQSYVAVVQIEDKANRFFGRILQNKSREEFGVDLLKDCTCIYLGSRGQTFFNYTVAIEAAEWHILDPTIEKLEKINETAWFKRRRFLIEKCRDASVIGILVCKLSGEQTKDIITRMKQLCRESKKKSYIISVGKPNVAKLANFSEIEVYVMIACPENDLYNNRDFLQPIVYPFELEVALNKNRPQYTQSHVTDFDDLLVGGRSYYDMTTVADKPDVSLITGKIRDAAFETADMNSMEIEKTNWMLAEIGGNLANRSWSGLEQKLGETEVKKAEKGRQGIPLHYNNEPE